MYIPIWAIVIGAILWYFFIHKKKEATSFGDSILDSNTITPEEIEERVEFVKERRIFDLEHFDSPHFIDPQNAFDAMEINYLRLKQRLSHTPDKVREIAKDWFKYAEALGDLKHARVMLDVDTSDNAFENLERSSKEPSIVKEEVEKKFKSLLSEDFQEVPPDYFQRMENAKKLDKKPAKSEQYDLGNAWEYFYQDSANLFRMREKRKKQNEEREAEKKARNESKKD